MKNFKFLSYLFMVIFLVMGVISPILGKILHDELMYFIAGILFGLSMLCGTIYYFFGER